MKTIGQIIFAIFIFLIFIGICYFVVKIPENDTIKNKIYKTIGINGVVKGKKGFKVRVKFTS